VMWSGPSYVCLRWQQALSAFLLLSLVDSFTYSTLRSGVVNSSSLLAKNVAIKSEEEDKNNEVGWKSRPAFPELARSNNKSNAGVAVKNVKSSERVPWDALRFVEQSSKFISRPKIPFLEKNPEPIPVLPGDVIWKAGGSSSNNNGNQFLFAPLDDVVMGGASSSEFDNETGIWGGTVTAANSGGFVGIRSTPFSVAPLDMSQCTGLVISLRSRGDGQEEKRLKAVLRDSTDFNGVCWTSCFDYRSKGSEWNILSGLLNKNNKNADNDMTAIKLPFSEQVPTIFARTVPDQTFDSKNVVGFQLVYSKFEYDDALNDKFALGDFSLQLTEMSVY